MRHRVDGPETRPLASYGVVADGPGGIQAYHTVEASSARQAARLARRFIDVTRVRLVVAKRFSRPLKRRSDP